jgi:hypothetical protein
VADNNKRLKDAQILLRHTAFRLTGMLHSSSFEDRWSRPWQRSTRRRARPCFRSSENSPAPAIPFLFRRSSVYIQGIPLFR